MFLQVCKRTKGSPAFKIRALPNAAGRKAALPGGQLAEKRTPVGRFPLKNSFVLFFPLKLLSG